MKSATKLQIQASAKIISVALPIICFFIFNTLTPVWWDDFIMSCVYNGWHEPSERLLSSFSDVINSTLGMYASWHGRSPVDFINFLFMYFGDKIIFNICNTIVYGILVGLICYHVTGSIKKIHPFLFLFVNILLWLFIPAWGQNFLWLTGSCNYLWTSVVILFFLIPFRKKADNSTYSLNKILSVLFLFVGILAGWSMENSAAGVFALLTIYFIVKIIRQERFSLFEILGTLGFLVGFYLLVRVRDNVAFDLKSMAVRCIKDTWVFFRLGGIITTLSILLGFEIIYFQKNKINYLVYAYFLAALAANYAMIFIEYNPERTFFMSGIFLIITLLCLIKEVLEKIKRRYIVMAVMAVVIPFFLPSFISGIKSIAKGYVLSEAREHYILSQKRKGVLDIQVKTPIPADDFHSGLKDGLDVLPQVDVNNIGYIEYITHNSSKAVYYGIHSLQGIMVEDKNWGNWKDWKKILKDSWKRRHSDYLTKDDWFLMIYDDWQ